MRATVASAAVLLVAFALTPRLDAQSQPAASDNPPDFSGIWDGTPRARPVNSDNVPWTKGKNFPEVNERALAYMKIFDEAFVMTMGGPNNSTLFYAYALFRNAFQYFRMGYASALAWLFFLILFAFTFLQFRMSRRWVYYAGDRGR